MLPQMLPPVKCQGIVEGGCRDLVDVRTIAQKVDRMAVHGKGTLWLSINLWITIEDEIGSDRKPLLIRSRLDHLGTAAKGFNIALPFRDGA